MIEGYDIKVASAPDGLTLGHALAASARHDPPFADKDVSFRDSLIVLSILAKVPRGSTLGIVAADNFFGGKEVATAAAERGVVLHVYNSVEVASGILARVATEHTTSAMLDALTQTRRQLIDQAKIYLPELTSFIQAHVKIPEVQPEVEGRIVYFHGIHVIDVIDVATTGLWPPPSDLVGAFVVDVSVSVDVTVERYEKWTPRELGVGQQPQPSPMSLEDESEWISSSRSEIDGFVSVDLARGPDGAIRLTRPKFESVAARSKVQGDIQKALRGEA